MRTMLAMGSVWFVGFVLAVRPSMRRQMLQEVCGSCGETAGSFHGSDHHRIRDRLPRGAYRARNAGDAAAALFFALWWPLWILVRVTARIVYGVAWTVGRLPLGTPLTLPELQRLHRERTAAIERDTRTVLHGDAPRVDT